MVRKKSGPVDEKGGPFWFALPEELRDPMDLAGTGPSVHLGHLFLQFIAVALHKTADHIKLAQPACLLSFSDMEDGADRFFNG
jgi:hypothetical protein